MSSQRALPGVALVTGAGRGIGEAIAVRLIAEGGEVVLLDRAPEVVDTAQRIGAVGSLQVDVTDVKALQDAVNAVAVDRGGLDTLVNCAGTCGRESFEEMSEEIWDRDLDTNVKAAVFACRAAVFPHMKTQGHGRLVTIASVSAKGGGLGPVHPDGRAGRSGAAYASSKAAAVNMTRWIAKQVGQWGITSNAVCPGPIESQMTAGADYGLGDLPVPRKGTPEEVAAAVAYLVGPESAYTTGAALYVDGGSSLA